MTSASVRATMARSFAGLALALALVAPPTGPSAAADLRVLANVLSPALLVLNLGAVCARQDPTFLGTTRRLYGDVPTLVEHVRDEVVSSLAPAEAESVLREAAGAARTVSLGMVRALAGGSDAEEAARLAAWCEETAKPFVMGVIAGHETRHDLFEAMLADAKR